MTYAELHFHLLPGLDDGPRTIDESIALAHAAVADGTSVVVATPHVHPAHVTDPAEIREQTQMLGGRLRSAGIELKVLPGGELEHSMVERLSQRDLELIAQGPPGRRWLLLEAAFDGLGDDSPRRPTSCARGALASSSRTPSAPSPQPRRKRRSNTSWPTRARFS
jgi:tyrosine-protein phosphatase YwqE